MDTLSGALTTGTTGEMNRSRGFKGVLDMSRLFLAAGVAALAIAAPVAAEKGGHQGGNKGQAAKVERGHVKQGGAKSSAAKVERGGGGHKVATFDRGKGQSWKADRHVGKAAKWDRRIDNRIDRRDVLRDRDFNRDRFDGDRFASARGWANGCPPGLWKKSPSCVPPGQAKNLGGLLPLAYRDRLLPLGLRDLYRDDDDYLYRLGDGYLYRVDRRTSLVESLLPLLGGGLMTGQVFPSAYGNYYVPPQYQAFYPDTRDDYYRYANGYVYEIDRDTGLIESAIPLLAGGYGMGQMLPASYSAYNVPYQYRDLYADSDDYMYRYAPGAIYQVDPSTRLITGVASLLAGNGLSVGQPLPMGYSAYNVPLAYRDQYYDTPDAWYRYNNGYIYQVDPTTQLVTSLIRAII
jgi:hypothetical protein